MPGIRTFVYSLVAVVAFVVAAAFPPGASTALAFSDVPEGHVFATAIEELSSRGIISGYTNGEFGIDDPSSRQQFAKMIVRTLALTVTGDEVCTFADVTIQSGTDPLYPSKYVAVCAEEGITSGKTATTFDPHGRITRQQLITMLARAMRFPEPPTDFVPPFSSGQFSLQAHYENACRAACAGLLDDLEEIGTTYDFQADATRGECAQLLYELFPQAVELTPNPDVVDSAQDLVDMIAEMQPTAVPDHFMNGVSARQEGDFDVTVYFGVLTHLDIEPGYVLDYVYADGGWGATPVVYARPVTQAAYSTYEEWEAGLGEWDPGMGYHDHSEEYLAHVQTDGTRESYLQLELLRLMGDGFYRRGVATLGATIVCDADALERVLTDVEAEAEAFKVDQPSIMWVRRQAAEIDLRPTVRFLSDGTVAIRYVAFAKFGGLLEITYTLSQAFSHQVLTSDARALVAYDWGIKY